MKKVYISGAITGNPNYKSDFQRGEMFWQLRGDGTPINPTRIELPLTYAEYMAVCYKLIDLCDELYVLRGWQKSKGARAEINYAKSLGKPIRFEEKQWALKKKQGRLENATQPD